VAARGRRRRSTTQADQAAAHVGGDLHVTVGAALEAQVRAGGADAQIVDLQPIAPREQPRPHDVEPLCERHRAQPEHTPVFEHDRIDRARDLRRLGLREDPALAGVLRGAEDH